MAFLRAQIMSGCLKRSIPITVLLPCDTTNFMGNGVKPAKPPYKTLYLLHGIYGSDLDWVMDTNIHRLAKEYQMAVVMPAGENHFYTDDEYSGIRYGEFIGKELVDVTRRMFCLSYKREDTFIGGLSMGGYGALVNGMKYHETFGHIACLSMAAVMASAFDGSSFQPSPLDETGFQKSVFNFEQVEELDTSLKNPFVLIQKLLKEKVELPKLYITAGTEDPLHLYARAVHEFLLENQVEHIYEEDEGGHNFEFWQKAIGKVLEWLPHEERIAGADSGNVFA